MEQGNQITDCLKKSEFCLNIIEKSESKDLRETHTMSSLDSQLLKWDMLVYFL